LPGKYFVELQERSIVSSISTETWVHVIELPNVASSKWILPTGKRTLIPVSASVLSVPNMGCFIASQSISHSAQVIGYESFCPVFSNISGNFTVYISVMDTVTSRILGTAIFLDPIRILSVLLSDVNPKSGCGTYSVQYYPKIFDTELKLCSGETKQCVPGISPNDFIICPVLVESDVFLSYGLVHSNLFPVLSLQTKHSSVSLQPTISLNTFVILSSCPD
jgi:hypothetical protein